MASGVAAILNDGVYARADDAEADSRSQVQAGGRRVVLEADIAANAAADAPVVVEHGTGKQADAVGYLVGGKTGTADKEIAATYRHNALISSFVGAFPMNDPRYVVLAMVDEPKGTKKTYGYATGGWVAAPVVRPHVIERMGTARRQSTARSTCDHSRRRTAIKATNACERGAARLRLFELAGRQRQGCRETGCRTSRSAA